MVAHIVLYYGIAVSWWQLATMGTGVVLKLSCMHDTSLYDGEDDTQR